MYIRVNQYIFGGEFGMSPMVCKSINAAKRYIRTNKLTSRNLPQGTQLRVIAEATHG